MQIWEGKQGHLIHDASQRVCLSCVIVVQQLAQSRFQIPALLCILSLLALMLRLHSGLSTLHQVLQIPSCAGLGRSRAADEAIQVVSMPRLYVRLDQDLHSVTLCAGLRSSAMPALLSSLCQLWRTCFCAWQSL